MAFKKIIRFCFITMICFGFNDLYGQTKDTPRYIFFLHNRFLEEYKPEDAHPEYGKVEYKEIIEAFKKEHFIVICEIRPRNADVEVYAKKIIRQTDSLIRKGIPASHITVVGTSKGGYIAMTVSTLLKKPDVNFVFIGCCSPEEPGSNPAFNFCGNVLSIYEKSDVLGQSCLQLKEHSTAPVKHFKELELNTGLKHGFLYKAHKEWLTPSIKWAKGEYN
jgi:hypothetical protein